MTELKDGIKKVVKDWMENEFDFVDVAFDWATPDMSRTDEQRYDDLAQRIADALVVDEDELNKITCDACGCGYCDTCRRIIKAISNAKPIKCEVGE